MVMLNAYSISNVNSPLNNFNSDFRSETSKFRGTIVITLLLTGMVTLVLTSAMGLIVTESSLPKPIKRLSYTLVHDRSKRNTVIWITFFFMCIATTLAVVRKIRGARYITDFDGRLIFCTICHEDSKNIIIFKIGHP